MQQSNLNPVGPEPKRSLLSRILSWRTIRVLLFLFICGLTLCALFMVEENIRGARAWVRYRDRAKARGEWVEPGSLIPPRVPDEENFAMTPSLAPILDFIPGTQKQRDTNAIARLNTLVELPNVDRAYFSLRTELDLVRFANGFAEASKGKIEALPQGTDRQQAAEAVLKALRQTEPVFEELRLASRRPHSRFNVSYDDKINMLLPHLHLVKKLCTVLQLRACAELALNRTEDAFADVELALYIADSIKNEPVLISHLVRIACIRIAMQPVWEGIVRHQWSESQLKALQTRLESYDFVLDTFQNLRGERDLFGASVFEMLRKKPTYLTELGGFSAGEFVGDSNPPLPARIAANLIPSGWIYLEQVNYYDLFNTTLLRPYNLKARTIDPALCQSSQAQFEKLMLNKLDCVLHHRVLSAMLLPAVGKISQRAADIHNVTQMAAVACALERYRLANGGLPEQLSQLAPSFVSSVPHDVISGEPLRYVRKGKDEFIVYSVGWNQKDDGGVKVMIKDKKQKPVRDDILNGDWVWQSRPGI